MASVQAGETPALSGGNGNQCDRWPDCACGTDCRKRPYDPCGRKGKVPTPKKKVRRSPGKGSRLRNTDTFRVTSNHDRETFLHIQTLAHENGVTISEQMRQLVEFGLETVEDGKEASDAPVAQTRS